MRAKSSSKFATAALVISIALTCASAALYVRAENLKSRKAPECLECHIIAAPAPGNSALLPSPKFHAPFKTARFATAAGPAENPAVGAVTSLDERRKIDTMSNEPDVVLLSELADKYNPVRFTHKKHADMAQMGDSCWQCHHNSPADRPHPSCKSCHNIKPDRNNPKIPRLEAAYHRHCIDCHRQWSSDKTCEICHEKKGKGPKITLEKGLPNPYKDPAQPGRVVYATKFKKTKVTFFHNDHTKLFRLACEDCHTKTGCASCHKTIAKNPVLKANHKTCGGCHDTETKSACEKCHRKEPMRSFTHNGTGFPLGATHSKLPCASCHHAHKPLSKISADCLSCHKGLEFKTFKHEATGFSLKPWHVNLTCANCHKPGKVFTAQNPNCTTCHKSKIKGFKHAATGLGVEKYHGRLACAACHPAGKTMSIKSSDCISCHKTGRARKFKHAKTGFPLKSYHAKLDCEKCHVTGSGFTKPADMTCLTCHKSAKMPGFDHAAVTGSPLGKLHSDFDCENCHTQGFGSNPDCSMCHDKNKSWPKDKLPADTPKEEKKKD